VCKLLAETSNPKVHLLLSKIKDRTGHGMVINTSFNVKDEPIVCTPDDAIRCFQSTGMDVLAIGPFIVTKTSALDPKTTA
jgi:carbamoyltransferase